MIAALLNCKSIAILPEEMSRERFEWLSKIAGEVIATPGSESNVKEIFDKTWELRRSGEDLMIFNQFDEFGNYLWHFDVTGHAMLEVLEKLLRPRDEYRGMVSATGSAGTIGSGDFMKYQFPTSKIVASEALQCPTLLENGFGAHRIEGIGDKHVPWIHNVKNTDAVVAIDDNAVVSLARLFNEPEGRAYLVKMGVPADIVSQLICSGSPESRMCFLRSNLLSTMRLSDQDVVLTILTDSMELYQSRLVEMHSELGQYTERDAAGHFARYLQGQSIDHFLELSYADRRRIHNLKYFTWVEQQGKTYDEINEQWYGRDYWTGFQNQVDQIDELIEAFNHDVGLLK